MRTLFEFRVVEKYASRLFGSDEGVRLGSGVRKITIASDDPRFVRIGELDREIRASAVEPPRYFYSGWSVRFVYGQHEMESAKSFVLGAVTTFGPPGEGCGTA